MTWFRRRQTRPAPSRPRASTSGSAGDNPSWTHPDRWRLREWPQPDLSYANDHMLAHYQDWDLYVPNLRLVQCGDKLKPALFFKIGYNDFSDWANEVEPMTMGWNWYRTKGASPYVIIELCVLFRSGNGAPLGVGGAEMITITTQAGNLDLHQLRSRAFLDAGDAPTRAAIEAWAAGPAPTMLFFAEERFRATSYVSMDLGPETKQDLLRVLSEATAELHTDGIAADGFEGASTLLAEELPGVSWWRD